MDSYPQHACRCGHSDFSLSPEPHPCHGSEYTCGKPAKRRFYNGKFVSLAGVQLKVQANETWACDACWDAFTKLAKEV